MSSTLDQPLISKRPFWRKGWLQRGFFGLLLALPVLRFSQTYWLMPTARRLARGVGVELGWERLDLALWRGAFEFRGLTVGAIDDDGAVKPLLAVDYVAFDLGMGALLTGKLAVTRASVGHVKAEMVRDMAGRWSFESLQGKSSEEEPGAAQPFDGFELPVAIERFEVVRLDLDLEDQASGLKQRFSLSASGHDLGSSEDEGVFQLDLIVPGVLEAMRLEGRLKATETWLQLGLDAQLVDLSPESIAEIASAFGVSGLGPAAHEVDGRVRLVVDGQVEGEQASWTLALKDLRFQADGQEVLRLDELQVASGPNGLGQVRANGLDLHLARQVDDGLVVLGFRLDSPATEEQAALDLPPDAIGVVPFGPLALADLRVIWLDKSASLEAPCSLEMVVSSLDMGRIQEGAGQVSFGLESTAPGIFESASLEGQLVLSGVSGVDASLSIKGLAPVGLKPYLAASGIESKWKAAEFEAALTGRFDPGAFDGGRLDAGLTRLALRDGDELVALESARLGGLKLGLAGLDVESVELIGPSASVIRRKDGTIEIAGLAFMPHITSETSSAQSAPSGGFGLENLPEIRIGKLEVRRTNIRLRDESVFPAMLLEPERLEFSLEGFSSFRGMNSPANLRLDFAQAGLVDRLSFEASVNPNFKGPGDDLYFDVSLRSRLEVEGFFSENLGAYLARAGIEGALEQGQFDVNLSADCALTRRGEFSGSLGLSELSLVAQGTEIASLARILVPFEVAPKGMRVGPVMIDEPRWSLSRDAAGKLGTGGLIFGSSSSIAVSSDSGPLDPDQPNPASAEAAPRVKLLGLELTRGVVSIDDRRIAGGTNVELGVEATVDELAAQGTSPFALGFTAPGLVTSATLSGELGLGPSQSSAFSVAGKLVLLGIEGAALSKYLPPLMAVDLEDGSFGFDFNASLSQGGTGANAVRSVRLELLDIFSRDEAGERLSVERLGLDLPEISKTAIEIAEFEASGVVLDVRRDMHGATHLAGLAFQAQSTPDTVETAQPHEEPVALKGEPREPAHPKLSLDALRLELAQLNFVDEMTPSSEPLRMALTLENRAPWVCDLSEEEEGCEPLGFKLLGHALPVASSISLDVNLAPFQSDVHLDSKLEIIGLSGAGLASVMPRLASRLDVSALEGGRFGAELRVDLNAARRGPLSLDLSRGISGEIELSEVGFARSEDAPIELGFRSLLADLRSVSATGIELDQLDLIDPVGRIDVVPKGISVAGMVLLPSSEGQTEQGGGGRTEQSGPVFDFSVREMFASGVDLVLRDLTSDPTAELPLNDLDLSITGFTTRAFRESLPLRFALFVGADDVGLPKREVAANVFTGFMGAAVAAVVGEQDQFELQQRLAFGGLDVAGQLILFPALRGWLKGSLEELELPVLRGPVRRSGVEIGDGLLDFNFDVRMLGARGASVSLVLRAAQLSLSEPPGGPISTYLKLPAPLDTVLFLLRDEEGDVVLPVDLMVTPEEGVEGLGVELAKVIGLVIGEAIASSPLRIVGGVLDMTGLADTEPAVLPKQPASCDFLAASSELRSSIDEELGSTFELLRSDPKLRLDLVHVFGDDDLEALAERANPSPEVCRALAERLSVERDFLFASWELEATRLGARFAAGDHSGIDAGRERLLEFGGELTLVEDALDSVLGLLRPSNARKAQRRTKIAALLLAEQRLAYVRTAILSQPIVSIGTRLRVRRPRFDEVQIGAGNVLVVPR